MTQSKKDDTFTIDVNDLKLDDILNTTGDITINLNDTYGATTTYSVDGLDDTITINSLDTHTIDWTANSILRNNSISPSEVEEMCKEYPGLEKVWRNFKTIYDMTLQDWKGKQDNNDYPF